MTAAALLDDMTLDLPTPTPAEIEAVTTAAIQRADARIAAALEAAAQAASDGAVPSFEALFGALDDAARDLATAYGLGACHLLMAGDDAVREAASAANERLEQWKAEVPQREDLARAIEGFVAAGGLDGLDDVERRYVERWRKDIRLAGGGLSPDGREEMARLTARLLAVASAFLANLAKPPSVTASRDELVGLPAHVVAAATPLEGDPESVELAVSDGVYAAAMEQARSRPLRERVYRAWARRGAPENLDLIREAISIRRRIAHLAGYPSWQAYRAEDLAAPDAAFINGFIDDLSARLEPVVRRDVAALTEVLRAEPGAADVQLEDWDWRYVDAIQRERLGVDQERLSEYFEFDRVLDGLATLSAEVFGYDLEERPGRIGWDPSVRVFDLIDARSRATLAHVFIDPWARPGKRPGAWMDALLPGGGRHGEARVPSLSLVLNVPPPGDGPALLPATQVEVLFHEFGHVMNNANPSQRFVAHRAQWVTFDFIEGPSEFNGRWGLQPEVIRRYARHHRTGEPIPDDLVDALVRSESLNAGLELQRSLVLGKFDALIHGDADIAIDEAFRSAWARRGIPLVEASSRPASFSHILGGAYDAALYGYAWSEVIRDDLLERFEAGGLTSPTMGAQYRRAILEVGWLDDPVAAVNAFLGRPWSTDAFLRRVGA